jgi:hypothetical protein
MNGVCPSIAVFDGHGPMAAERGETSGPTASRSNRVLMDGSERASAALKWPAMCRTGATRREAGGGHGESSFEPAKPR